LKNADENAGLAPPSPFNGNRLRVGKGIGGKKGRSGRKTNDFIAECQRLADEVVLEKVGAKLVASDPDDPAWRWSAEYVSKYVKSEAPKQVALTDGDGLPARFTFVIDSPLDDSDN
jgi:hypothetical protein